MAYSIRFSGVGKDGATLFSLEPHWWVVSKLVKVVTTGWVTTNDTGSYQDDDVDIPQEVASTLHKMFKPELLHLIEFNTECVESTKLDTDQHAASRLDQYTKYVGELNSALETIEAALGKDAENYSHFHVCVFEWDSGL